MTRSKQDRPDSMPCQRCGEAFAPLRFDAKFCGKQCRDAQWKSCPGRIECGPCPTCGKTFLSRRGDKRFCSHACYTGSDQFREMVTGNLKKINPSCGTPRACRGCGKEYPRARRATFCARSCMRSWYAARFDRWIANPERVALPQNYDEFLDRDVLPCPVDGCKWEGSCLSRHVNAVHGIPARDFKKLAGFNVKTGLVGKDLSARMADRARAMNLRDKSRPFVAGNTPLPARRREHRISLEAKEHAAKARADMPSLSGETLPCRACGAPAPQPIAGKRYYCSLGCRNRWYRQQVRLRPIGQAACGACGKRFPCMPWQAERRDAALPVFCSYSCRQRNNSRRQTEERRRIVEGKKQLTAMRKWLRTGDDEVLRSLPPGCGPETA